MRFAHYLGIDYSGAGHCDMRQHGTQLFSSTGGDPRSSGSGWTRRGVAEYIASETRATRTLVGIDHAFSLPISYLRPLGLSDWDSVLDHVRSRWPDEHRDSKAAWPQKDQNPEDRPLRLTEARTSSAKSVFLFDVPGQVGKASLCGMNWLRHLRRDAGVDLFFWPFDGWRPRPGVSVIVETYPSILRNRYERGAACRPEDDHAGDKHDAYCIARWLRDLDRHDHLDYYFSPPLTVEEERRARREGWIFGIT